MDTACKQLDQFVCADRLNQSSLAGTPLQARLLTFKIQGLFSTFLLGTLPTVVVISERDIARLISHRQSVRTGSTDSTGHCM
jgi:hypothetical protein